MNNREYGTPKTEEERIATHSALYSSKELPPRGTGQQSLSLVDCAAKFIIDILDESMRADDEINLVGSTGINTFEFERVKAGRLLHITHLSGYDDTSSPTKLRVGYYNGHRYNWIETVPAPLISETVAFNGLLRLGEGMIPAVRFEGVTSGDDLYATLNGFWTRT